MKRRDWSWLIIFLCGAFAALVGGVLSLIIVVLTSD